MVFRWLVNAGLLAIPIGATVGTLVGIDAHRHAKGQAPLFSEDEQRTGSSPPGGDGGSKHDGITNTQYCQSSFGITPSSEGSHYTLNPNQWGVTSDTIGSLCMNITTFENGTYSSQTTAPEFSVTWQFDPALGNQPVHAFPNIMIDDVLPLRLDKIDQINIDLHWTYGLGEKPTETTMFDQLNDTLNANVALDMFLHRDAKKAQKSTEASHEVMVWFARFGPATPPLGWPDVVQTKVLNETKFELYVGKNGQNQNVMTWLSPEPAETFTGDLYPLVEDLLTMRGNNYPSKSDYMGVLQMGTEAFSSPENVTFSVPKFSIDLTHT